MYDADVRLGPTNVDASSVIAAATTIADLFK